MNTKFANFVEKECTKALVREGFESPRMRTRYIQLNEEFLGWVGLNRGNYADYLQINPFIGIHCIPIMKMVKELQGAKYKIGETATFAIHMGEIAPNVKQYIFQDETNITEVATRLSAEIMEFALPWMTKNASFESLLPKIEQKVDMLGGNPQWYASGLFLSGQEQNAKEFVQKRTDLFDKEDHGQYSIYYRFAEPFFEMVERGSTETRGSESV